jgi:uncharacterized protein
MPSATFFFHGTLQHFLPRSSREHWVSLHFISSPSIKDAFESLGVPHVEVRKVCRQQHAVAWSEFVKDGDQFELFPFLTDPAAPKKFVLDVHLGKLSRYLRLLGFDVSYNNHSTDQQIARTSSHETRTVLTRDICLLKQKIISWGYWLRSQQPEEQLREVLFRYQLIDYVKPFHRCLDCNGLFECVSHASVKDEVARESYDAFKEFYRCTGCNKVYWKGSHYERMNNWVQQMITDQRSGTSDLGVRR